MAHPPGSDAAGAIECRAVETTFMSGGYTNAEKRMHPAKSLQGRVVLMKIKDSMFVVGRVFILLAVVDSQCCLLADSAHDLKAVAQEIENLKEGQRAIQQDLKLIKDLLLGKRAPDPTHDIAVNVEDAPFLGDKNAKVSLIEFTDYQCPFCGRHAKQTLPRIIADYVGPGNLKYIILEAPMESLHPAAWKAAEAAHCAAEQGKYWEMHDQIFANQRAIEQKDLSFYAKVLGLDVAKFDDCLATGKTSVFIRRNRSEAEKAGVEGTPTFFLGVTDPNGSTVKTSRKIVGAMPYDDFKDAVEGLLQAN